MALSKTVRKAKVTQYYEDVLATFAFARCCGVCAATPESGVTYSQPLSVVDLARREESVQGVVTGDDEAGNVDKELASDVEEDKEEVKASETEDGVDLGDGSLLLEVVEGGVLGQLGDDSISTQRSI
jgi:hypothetical protein